MVARPNIRAVATVTGRRPLHISHNLRPVVAGFSGLGQQDITGGICMDASGNATPCPGTIPPPATGSGYQQWASGAITTAPGPVPGTPSSGFSLTIPGAAGAPVGSTTANGSGSGTTGAGTGSNSLAVFLLLGLTLVLAMLGGGKR